MSVAVLDTAVPTWVSGQTAIVGSDSYYLRNESAHIFRFDGTQWIEEQKLICLDPGIYYGAFGRSVSIDGDTLVVGALAKLYDSSGNDTYEADPIQGVLTDGPDGSYYARAKGVLAVADGQ